MPSGKKIEDLVDRTIDEAIARHDIDEKDVKKRRPKPFRYLTDKEEIQAELEREKLSTISVMKPASAPKIIDERITVLGLGDMQTIESVIRRHEISRKFKER